MFMPPSGLGSVGAGMEEILSSSASICREISSGTLCALSELHAGLITIGELDTGLFESGTDGFAVGLGDRWRPIGGLGSPNGRNTELRVFR